MPVPDVVEVGVGHGSVALVGAAALVEVGGGSADRGGPEAGAAADVEDLGVAEGDDAVDGDVAQECVEGGADEGGSVVEVGDPEPDRQQ